MYHFFYILLIGLFTIQPQNNIDKIDIAIQTGNATLLVKNFTTNVDLTVLENDGTYSRSQAELILKKFFSQHPPADFKVVHSGESKLGIRYRLGTLSTKEGDFRVTYHQKKIGDKWMINQFSIENE